MEIEPDPSGDFLGIGRPSAKDWKLKEQERELFVSAEDVPNWRLADKARRLVLDMGHFLSEVIQQYNETEIEDLEPGPAQQIAAMSLSTLMVRSAGSGLVLVSGGYVPTGVGGADPTLRRGESANWGGA